MLAFGIRIPTWPTTGWAAAIRASAGQFAGFALTFAVIGLFWMAHHRMFHVIRRVDSCLIVLNLVLLALIAITARAQRPDRPRWRTSAAVIFYAATVALAGPAHGRTLALRLGRTPPDRPDSRSPVDHPRLLRSGSVVVVFGLSIPIALFIPQSRSVLAHADPHPVLVSHA